MRLFQARSREGKKRKAVWCFDAADDISSMEMSFARDKKVFIAAFAALFILIFGSGCLYLLHRKNDGRKSAHNELSAIADLKLRQIIRWRDERMADARFLGRARFIANDLRRLFNNPASEQTRDAALQWLSLLCEENHYRKVEVLDDKMKLRLILPDTTEEPARTVVQLFDEARRTGSAVMGDLHRDEPNGAIHLNILVPIFDRTNGSPTETPELLAVILLTTDAEQFIYPLLRTWPVASATAETLLVRRDGDDVLYLNELRHKPGSALNLRLPLKSPLLPAAQVLRGEAGVIEGIDYRGAAVIATARLVPETPWTLEAKIDQQEVYAPLKREVTMICLALVAMLSAAGLLVLLLWRKRGHELALSTKEQLSRLNQELEIRVAQRTDALKLKNSELETFAYSVSHDLKAPVRSIESFTHFLRDEYSRKIDAQGMEYIDRILRASERMRKLIEDLLSYSRLEIENVKLSIVNPKAMVEQILDEFHNEIQTSNTRVIVDIECAPMKTDASGLEQALRNLISNAIKFSARSPAPEISITGCDSGRTCHISIQDNGVGFDMKYMRRIFQVFQRLHPGEDFTGTGIGLAIVRKAMQRIGGNVRAQSEPGKGAIFFLEFPRGEADEEYAQPDSGPTKYQYDI